MQPVPAKLLRNERGATAVEYGLIAAIMVVAVIGAFQALANTNTGMWAVVSERVVAVSAEN